MISPQARRRGAPTPPAGRRLSVIAVRLPPGGSHGRALRGRAARQRMFAIPGLGAYFIDAANNRDHFLILGLTAFGAIALMVANLLVDVAYALIDSRIRYE